MLENTNKKLLKEKEILFASNNTKNNRENLNKQINYFPEISEINLYKNLAPIKFDKNKEKVIQQQMDEKIKAALAAKETELKNKFKEKEFIAREDCSRQVYEINKILQEKILQNEKLIFEMEILKSKFHNKELDEKEKLEELRASIFLLETENEKLLLTNKMNNEIIAQLESKSFNNLTNNLTDKEKINDSEPNSSNDFNYNIDNNKSFNSKNPFNKQKQFFKNEILIIELKSQISKLENSLEAKEKLIENLKDKIKVYSNDNLRKEYELKHNLFEIKNKELAEFYLKMQNLESERRNLIEENECLKSNLNQALEKINEFEDLIKTKYELIESDLQKEKQEKQILEKKLKEISGYYKENHESLLEEANDFRELLSRKDQEIEKLKSFYEKRIQQVIN